MKFRIGWDRRDKGLLFGYWNEILANDVWSQGKYTRLFEEAWGQKNERLSVAFGSWTGAALAALAYYGIEDKTVVCPGNTMVATVKAPLMLGNKILFVDVNREDLCMSYDSLVMRCGQYVSREGRYPEAVILVHIGGHLAFETRKIVEYCRAHNMVLIEDCAHAHGATYGGQRAGTFGAAGLYSFFATKTITTGEGGMLVTGDENLAKFARLFRNYGKDERGAQGFQNRYSMNYRMSEFTAALGLIETHRLDSIVDWKNGQAQKLNEKYKKRVEFPAGMKSGHYKYIVFEDVDSMTGSVYGRPVWEEFWPNVPGSQCLGNSLSLGVQDDVLPNTRWVCENHRCVPIFYDDLPGIMPRWE